MPFGSGHPFDLAVYWKSVSTYPVQARLGEQGLVVFNAYSTDHGRGPVPIGLADLFGVWFPPSDQVYLAPVEALPATEGRLRLEPTRNNQKRGIRFATDFEIGRWTEDRLLSFAAATRAPAA